MTEYWDGTGVTAEALVEEVRRLAAEQPDYMYDPTNFDDTSDGCALPKCRYTHYQNDGTRVPGCIIGKAIYNLTGKLVDQAVTGGGVLDFPFMQEEYAYASGWSDQARWLAAVQRNQDEKMYWGRAVELADAEYSIS